MLKGHGEPKELGSRTEDSIKSVSLNVQRSIMWHRIGLVPDVQMGRISAS